MKNNNKEIKELLSEEEIELEEESPRNIISAIREIRGEINTLSYSIWSYAKYLLKFGLASWVFGISSFIASIMILKGPGALLASYPISLASLIVAGAPPLTIAGILVRRLEKRKERLTKAKEELQSLYEKAMLKKLNKIS